MVKNQKPPKQNDPVVKLRKENDAEQSDIGSANDSTNSKTTIRTHKVPSQRNKAQSKASSSNTDKLFGLLDIMKVAEPREQISSPFKNMLQKPHNILSSLISKKDKAEDPQRAQILIEDGLIPKKRQVKSE